MNDNDEEEPYDDEKGNDRGLEVIKEEENNENNSFEKKR